MLGCSYETRCGKRVDELLIQAIRHAGYYPVLAEQERAFDQQRGLVVQQIMPPARRDKLRQHDCNHVVVPLAVDLVEVAHEWTDQRAVGRVEDDKLCCTAPFGPLSP